VVITATSQPAAAASASRAASNADWTPRRRCGGGRRTRVLVTLAAAAVATGVAVPALAISPAAPTVSPADAPGSGQSVIDWNRRLITILGTPNAQPATVHPTRSFAMLQAAEYDAVVSITHGATPYRATVPAPAGARPDAAADQAAHDVLVALYPAARADLDAQLSGELGGIPAGQGKQDGVGVGAAAAKEIVTLRATDGSAKAAAPFVAGTAPGDYRPTPPKNAAPMYTGWGSVSPFVLDRPQQFRPAAPPDVSSPAYTAALDEVRTLGRDTSTTRTPDETAAGTFWSSAPVWHTRNQIAQQAATDHDASLAQASASFAGLDLALADTTIAMYDAKYADHVWRPITAIQVGAGDPAWNPLTPTAADPSYPCAPRSSCGRPDRAPTSRGRRSSPTCTGGSRRSSAPGSPGRNRAFRCYHGSSAVGGCLPRA
jgi:hypothetical protein